MTYLRRGTLRLDRSATTLPLKAALTQKRTRPRKVGDGPPYFSATTVIDRQPFRWDCNGFYRLLGVATDATKVELARAYIEGDCYLDPQATYAFTVLLRPETRAAYDSLPLGTFWAQDPALAVNLRVGDLEGAFEEDWSYYLDSDLDECPATWPFSFWRTLIATALTRTDLAGSPLCLGVTRSKPRVDVLGYNIVIFMRLDELPSGEYASQIAHELVAMMNPMH